MNQYQSGQVMFEYVLISFGIIVLGYGWFNKWGGSLGGLIGLLQGFYDRYTVFIAQLII